MDWDLDVMGRDGMVWGGTDVMEVEVEVEYERRGMMLMLMMERFKEGGCMVVIADK